MAFRASEGGFSFKEAAEVVDEHLGARLEEMRRFTRGLRNSNFRLDLADGSTCVLRVFHGEDPAAQAVEVLALRHLAARPEAAGLPVPRVLGHGRGPESGSPYVLLTFLPGVNAGRGLPGLAEEERPAFAAALGGLMARLHSVPPPLPGFGRWLRVERDAVVPDGGPRPGALSFEQASFAHALRRCREEGLLSAEGARLAERFVARRWHAFDEREAAVFVHHDLHADNVLMEPRAAAEGGLRISGLLDFEHARGRAAEYDWVMAAWSLPEDGSDLALEAPGPLLRAFLEGYAAVRPLHPLWRERWLCYQMIKAVGFLAYKPAYVDFIEWNRRHVLRLASLDAG
ncbi:MAG: phosphotransferase [Firmicutes bacterium]|nr:phosphotransferase [Bacillota bacterium]MBE3590880.1 phosphotransferase [Bacillota bacterium]